MNFVETEVKGVYIIEPKVFNDERGYFAETFRDSEFSEHIMPIRFIQENENQSTYGVLRGLHYQKPPYTQSKLVRAVYGNVLDVAVDLRTFSPTFGKWVAVELSDKNHRQLFLPKGIAHGMACLSEMCLFQYKVDNYYAPQSEGYLAWDSPELNIDWHLPVNDIILSEKDKHHKTLTESDFLFREDNLY